MSNIKEILAAAFLPVIKQVGESEIEAALQGIKEHNPPATYNNAIQAGYSFFSLIQEAAAKSKTKIDDTIVAVFLEAIRNNAETNGIELPV
jgi:hypothetical protein